jgi:Domain of unknown function (DUF4188)
MSTVFPGRWTAEVDDDGVAVFLIGMRFNQWWRVDKWWGVFTAMPAMLRHLAKHQEAGMLAGHIWFGRTIILVSYWRSAEHLIRFASAIEAPHRDAWKAFNRRVGSDGSVGIWHETYLVGPGSAETIYGNMPMFGLAKATKHVEVTGRTGSARQRLARGES